MANTCYDNFFLSNEIEDQYQSHLDLQQFCTVDNNLTGVAGMVRKIHKYKATDGTEKLAMGVGNTKTIEAGYTEKEYRIQMAQNRFQYYDEEAMTDPMVITTGTQHAGTDMFNTVNADIFTAFNEATMTIVTTALGFDAFVDGAAMLNLENLEGVTIFGFVNPADMAKLRKALKDDLKYVEAYAKHGYVGTVGGINIYTKKNAETGKVVIATKEAVTLFNKKGTEVEQEREGNIRRNTVGAQCSAPSATMDYRPFAVFSHPDRNSIHNTAAVGSAVARLNVQMQAGKAVRAMVAMIAARAIRRDTPSADLADEAVVAGMGFVVSVFALFPFVFAIH